MIPLAIYNDLPGLEEKAKEAISLLGCCEVCPRHCRVNRLEEELGFCRIGRRARIYSSGPHFGEEPPLVGTGGSGTIFFSGCNLSCVYCQNYEISQMDEGREMSAENLAEEMVSLQKGGCHNINFVTPSHVVPQIIEALVIARDRGLTVPLVYNSGGYDRVETLKLLDGIFDIYMPDAKYGSEEAALKYSRAPGYVKYMKEGIKEMHHQVGDLAIEDGVAVRGLLVRHLILPGDLANTSEIVRFLSEEISKETYLNVMAQYRPEYNACSFPELGRRPTLKEYRDAVKIASDAGLTRGLAIY